MKFVNKNNVKVGDTVLVPINGEMFHDEQICLEYEVVMALHTRIKPEDQIVGDGQDPLPEWLPLIDGIAYLED